CGTDERPCPVSRVPVKILATLSEVSEKAISSVGVDFFSQSKKSLCLCSPFDGSDEGLVSTVPTLPSGLASFLLRQSGSLKRHKQPHSGVEKTSYRPSKKSKIPNIWVETEEYFKDLTMADIDALSEVSLFGTSATWKYFFISVLGNARGVHEGGFSEEKMKFSNENVNFVIDEEDDGQSMEIDSVEDAEISQKETSSSSVSEPSVGLEWLSGYRNKICPATERPSKKRKLLGVDAGLEKELVASSCDGNTSLCNFCSSDDLEKELNWLVSCSSCQISVHQKFYGVQEDVDLSCPCSWCKQMTGSNDSNNNLLDFEGVELSTSISLNEVAKLPEGEALIPLVESTLCNKQSENGGFSMGLEEDCKALKVEVSEIKGFLRDSIQQIIQQLHKKMQESLQEMLQQQFKTFLVVQEKSRTVQEFNEDVNGAAGNTEKEEKKRAELMLQHPRNAYDEMEIAQEQARTIQEPSEEVSKAAGSKEKEEYKENFIRLASLNNILLEVETGTSVNAGSPAECSNCNSELSGQVKEVFIPQDSLENAYQNPPCSVADFAAPYICKKLLQLQNKMVDVKTAGALEFSDGLKHGDISCFEVPLYSNSCRIHATKYSRCKEMTCNADGVRLEKFVLDRKMGILDFSPKDEVEGEIIYYQNRLLSNAIAREHFTDNLKFNIAKRLPQEIDLACMSRWDDVLVTQYLYELREAKKQGRKERRHKEVQAALSVAASNSPSSFRKDTFEETTHQENMMTLTATSVRFRGGSQPIPRAEETLQRVAVPMISLEKQSNFAESPVDFSKESAISCDICRGSEKISNHIIVCDICKLKFFPFIQVAVHLDCYCSDKESTGPWYCELCKKLSSYRSSGTLSVNYWEKPYFVAECGLCGGTTGAFRKCSNGEWVHAFCAEWVFELRFIRGQVNSAEGMKTVSKAFDMCLICHRRFGVCIKCNYGRCQTTFHPSCARSAGFHMDIVKTSGGKKQHKAYCEKHSLEPRAKAEAQRHGIELNHFKQVRVELDRLRLLCDRIIKREKLKPSNQKGLEDGNDRCEDDNECYEHDPKVIRIAKELTVTKQNLTIQEPRMLLHWDALLVREVDLGRTIGLALRRKGLPFGNGKVVSMYSPKQMSRGYIFDRPQVDCRSSKQDKAKGEKRSLTKDRTVTGLAEQIRLCLNGQARMADEMCALRESQAPTQSSDYRRKFESLAAAMGTMGDQGLQAAYVNGLKMDIQGPLRLLHPNGLIRAMELSESIEANQALVRGHKVGSNRPFNSRPNSLILPESRAPHMITSPTYSTTSVQSKSTSASSTSSPTHFKRFTEAELREKKARGVCFKCDGRWFRGHECKEAELVVIV
ncbi:hypothetical protein G4B88_008546, partial [Cannabis sativa]